MGLLHLVKFVIVNYYIYVQNTANPLLFTNKLNLNSISEVDNVIEDRRLNYNKYNIIQLKYPIKWNEKIIRELKKGDLTYNYLFPESENVINWILKDQNIKLR